MKGRSGQRTQRTQGHPLRIIFPLAVLALAVTNLNAKASHQVVECTAEDLAELSDGDIVDISEAPWFPPEPEDYSELYADEFTQDFSIDYGSDEELIPLGTHRITFYTDDPAENGGQALDAKGGKLMAGDFGTVAADFSHIPYGSTVYIEGYGYKTVRDTGGHWTSDGTIDIFIGSDKQKARELGVQHKQVWLVVPAE